MRLLALASLSIVTLVGLGATACSSEAPTCEGQNCESTPAQDAGKVVDPFGEDAKAAPPDASPTMDSGKPETGVTDASVDAGPATGTEINPYGVAYPTKGLGKTARTGSTPGGVFANLKFDGYLKGDTSKGLQTISMADYFDPQMKSYKVLILAGTGNWCGYCQKEVQEAVTKSADFASAKVGVLNAVFESKTHAPAVVSDLDTWIATYKITFPAFLDSAAKSLKAYAANEDVSFPFNIVLDARSMEILAIMYGSPSEGLLTRAKTYTKWVDSHPATTY